MRKVFLSTMPLYKHEKGAATMYTSDDFDLAQESYNYPISYLIDDSVEKGDSVVVITAVQKGENGKVNNAELHYVDFLKEAEHVKEKYDLSLELVEIPLYEQFDSTTFNRFFKYVSQIIQEEDLLYFDTTFGQKPYSIAFFVAMAYTARASRDVDVETLIYAQKYSGYGEPNKSRIYDITSLYYLNSLAGNAQPGQKGGLDHLLNFIIDD